MVATATHIAFLLAGFSVAAHGAEPMIKAETKSDPKTEHMKAALPAKPAQADIKFLEYLGTAEGDGENWTDVGAAEAVSENKASAKVTAKLAVERK